MSNRTTGLVFIGLFLVSIAGMAWLWWSFGWMPAQKSNLAPIVDAPFNFVNWASTLLFLGVVAAMIIFMTKYRRKSPQQRAERVEPSHRLEITWSVVPTILVLIIFTWGFKAFVTVTVAPPDSYQIYVTAKKWLWEYTYPNGLVTNDLYVPVDRPVKLIMTSEDVLHSFFVPEFRVKHDVVPNRYTTVWFQANEETSRTAEEIEEGSHIQIFCTEYCGTGHSVMATRLHVLSQNGFNDWLESGGGSVEPTAEYGEQLYTSKFCAGCHSLDGSPRVGPTFQGLFGKQESLADGSTVTVDEDYLRESIVNPAAQIVAGYQNQMSLITLSGDEVQALIEYIKTVN